MAATCMHSILENMCLSLQSNPKYCQCGIYNIHESRLLHGFHATMYSCTKLIP